MKMFLCALILICCIGSIWADDYLEVDFVSGGQNEQQAITRITRYIEDVLSSYRNPDFVVEIYSDPEYGQVIHVSVSATNRFNVRSDSGRLLSILAAIGTVAEMDPRSSWYPYSADKCIISFDNMDIFCTFDSLSELLDCNNADANAAGEWARANITYQERIETAEDCINDGFASIEADDLIQAKSHFQQALVLEPYNPVANMVLGAIYLEEEQYDMAIVYTSCGIDNYPHIADAYTIRGMAYTYSGEFENALADYETCMSIDTTQIAGTMYNIACLYAIQNEVSMSIQYLEQAVEAGYTNMEWLNSDPDFDSIRGTQEFIDGVDRIALQIGEY